MIIDITKNGDVKVAQSNEPYYYFTWINYNGSNDLGIDLTLVPNGSTETIANLFAATTEQDCFDKAETLELTLTPIFIQE